MCVAGGKRCEYSDALSNVRRKVRSKMKNHPDAANKFAVKRELDKAVTQFLKDNPELVAAHLPEKMGFNCDAPKWEVPTSLLQQLGSAKVPVKGRSAEEAKEFYKNLAERNTTWRNSLTMTEENAVASYTATGFQSINPYLRKKGYAQWMKENSHFHSQEMKDAGKSYAEARIIPNVASIDAAMDKAPVLDQPEKFYRFFQIPTGVTPEQYVDKYLQPGSGYQDKGYLSVSGDSEYVASHVASMMEEDEKGEKQNNGYVVMEILSKSGTTLQEVDRPSKGDIQSCEAETLIGRGTKMRIIGSAKRDFVFGQDRYDLEHLHTRRMPYDSYLDCTEGAKVNILTVQMIDENLIRDTRKTEK